MAWPRDRLLIPWGTFPAVIRASPVGSMPDGDFSTFVALLPHLPPLTPPAIQGCPDSGSATLGHPGIAGYPQGPGPPRSQTPPRPSPYLEEEEEDDTGAAGSAQHPLGPCPPQSLLPWGWVSLPLRLGGLRYPGGMSGPSPPLPAAGSLWHWLLHRPRSIPLSLCQQQSCSKPSLIKETHSLVLPPRGGLGDALTGGAGGLRGRPTPPEGDRYWPRADPTAVGCSAPTVWPCPAKLGYW